MVRRKTVRPSSIGLRRGTVKLSRSTAEWRKLFLREKRALQVAIGNKVLDVQHIGSTAILGMPAKPIIDIAVAVKSIQDVKDCIEPLGTLGYVYKGAVGMPHHRFFAKGEPVRTHYAHFVVLNSGQWNNYLMFRDFLRDRPDVREQYAKLKRELYKKFPNDRASYTSGKSQFVRTVLRRARQAVA